MKKGFREGAPYLTAFILMQLGVSQCYSGVFKYSASGCNYFGRTCTEKSVK